MLDDLGGGERAERRAGLQIRAARQPGEETRGVEIARAGRVDELLDRERRDLVSVAAVDDDRALLRSRHGGEHAFAAQRVERFVEVRRLVERQDLVSVGEHRVDDAAAHEVDELAAETVDAERIRQRQRDAAIGGAGDLAGLEERRLRRRPVPHVAFEIDDARRADQGLVDVVGRQMGAGAEKGVHRPLAVGRHVDEAAPGRRAIGGGRGGEADAGRAQVGDEGAAEGVVLDLADIGAADAERGDADDRVGRRAAGDDARLDARRVERLGALLVDQRHRAFHHVLRQQDRRRRSGR